MLAQVSIIRDQVSQNAKRAEVAAKQARATKRAPTTPTTIQYRREESVVNQQSPLENFATQLTEVQKTTGKVMGGVAESAQVVRQNIQSLFENFLPFGPVKAEAPSVDGPDKKNANIKSAQTQGQGPRPVGNWTQRVTSNEGGGRGGRE